MTGSLVRWALVCGLVVPLACERGRTATRTQVPASASEMVISLRRVPSGGHGADVAAALEERPAVYGAQFDHRTAEVHVHYDARRTSPEALLEAARASGVDAVFGPGKGSYVPEVEFGAGADVEKIGVAGEAVSIRRHVVRGKVTVFDFYAPWCLPCRVMDRHLAEVLSAHDDVAVRKLNVVDFDTPLAKQHLSADDALPYLLVYDRRGRRVAAVVGIDPDGLDDAIARARQR